MIKIVHCMKESYDIYIGRGKCPRTGKYSKWGNPFKIGKDGTREEVVEKYRKWIKQQPTLMNNLHELKDKILGCWCFQKPCHGDILIELIEKGDQKIGK